MRLIDADCMKEYLYDKIFGAKGKIDAWVDAQPTIEAEPVRHGHWIELWTGYKCSECAHVLIIAPIAPFGNYCPYCGAKNGR